MSRTAPGVDLRPDHWAIVCSILRQHVPDRKVLAFGSRATWAAKDYSDLDLAIMGDEPLSPDATSALAEGFGNSDLPFKVDLVDWAKIDEIFRDIVRRDGVTVQVPGAASEETGRGCRSLATSRRSTMGGEWQEIPFSEVLAEPVRNGIYKRKEFHGRGFKIVNMGELFAYPRLGDVPMKRVELSETEKARFAVHADDLLFARRSLVAEGAGKCSVVLDISEPTTFESSIIRARPNVAEVDSLFLYYFFNSPQGLHALDSIRWQVAVAGITGGDLARLNVPKPPLSQQRAIAHILGTLDDKIELNRRMNETLERMARALFKSWFVDFDPVRAKMEGHDTGLPRHLADLFPDRLVNSEMGKIPEGWEVFRLDQLANHHTKTTSPSRFAGLEYEHFSIPAYDAGQRPAIELGAAIRSNKTVVLKDAVLLSKLNPRIARVWVPADSTARPQICSTEFLVFTPRSPANRNLLFTLFGDQRFRTLLESLVTRTSNSHQRVPPKALKAREILTGSPRAFTTFGEVIGGTLARILKNRSEAATLAALRDTLLPKLISGETRVGDAERVVESVT